MPAHPAPRAAVAVVLAAGLCLSFAQPPPEGRAVELGVSRVMLFTSGVGAFEHTGTVIGTQEVELRVPDADMDDLLASLVIEDRDGGRVMPVRYGAREPLGRVLASYALDLSSDPSLAELLAQARGEAVRVETDASVVGLVVNVERVTGADGGSSTLLTLSTPTGLRRIALEDVREIHFEREALRDDLDAALAAIARGRTVDANVVRLRFEGEGERRVRITYLREMPVWKPSYRLVVGADGRADLQGWAIFDNPTHLDLTDVQVAFVAGRPVSFVADLFDPVYAERPRVHTTVAKGFVPPVDGGTFAAPAARASAPAAESVGRSLALADVGVEAMAEGVSTGASFAYVVRDPVSVGRFESVMVPVLLADVAAPRSSFLPVGATGPSPLRALRIVNDTGLHLPAGPVAIFDEGGFVGSALLGDVPPGDDRLVAFAVDLDVRIASETTAESETVIAVALRGPLLETVHRSRIRTTVRVIAGADERFIVIELPRRPLYEVRQPTPAPIETADTLRFAVAWAAAGAEVVMARDDAIPTHVTCVGGEACRLEVVFERVDARTVTLANVDSDRLAFYLENVALGDADRAVLEDVLAAQRRVAGLARAAADAEARLDALFRDQERVRQNMAALDRASGLYRRYLADLEVQEDAVAALGAERDDLRLARRLAHDELDTLLAGLGGGLVD